MIDFERKEHYSLSDLLHIVALLRSEGGCPWDRVQTHASLRRSLLEEAYEAAEAIDRADPALLKEELGDLLLQVVFHADIERQAGDFTMDDVADGETSVNAYNKLMDWGMQLLAGPTTTGAAQAVSAVTNTDRTFMLTPSASSTDVIDGKDNVFQVCFTDPNQGISSADYIAENMPDAKIAVLYRNDDAYSQGIHDTFVKEATEKGMSVVYKGTFTNDTATDFSVQLSGAQSAGADLVFMPIYYQPASIVLAQAKAMGYAPTFFGVDGMDGILTMEGFDPSLAEGLMLLTPFSATVPETQSFVEAYTAANDGVTPNQFAADAYDGVYIVKEALEKAGCTADMSSADICEALVAQMTQISYSGLTGKDMTWNAEGQVSKAPTAYVIKGGEYVLPEA